MSPRVTVKRTETHPRLQPHRRPLRVSEQRLLRAKARSLERADPAKSRLLPVTGLVFGALWGLTLLATDVPWTIVTAFWIVTGAGITLWVKRDLGRDRSEEVAMLGRIGSALERNTADVYDIRSSGYAEFEEVEDEGACYAFELDSESVVFVAGQQFYPAARFPSLDFSLVHVLDKEGHTVDEIIEKRGPRTAPDRVVPSRIKWESEVPEHLEVRSGSLNTLDEILKDALNDTKPTGRSA